MTLLEVENLKTQFPTERGIVEAVNNVDFRVEEGELVGLVGESGSGKSVLSDSIMRIVDEPGEIVQGSVRFKGEPLLDKSEEEMQEIRGGAMSRIFQDAMSSLNPTIPVGEQVAESIRLHRDVGESVSFPAEMKRKIIGTAKNSESWQRAIEMLETVGIPEPESRATDFPHQFSGGMRQRAMIASALSTNPDLLIADEPTTALDVTIQAQILDELKQLQKELGTAIILVTHDLSVIAETCDRVNVMYAGEIVERSPADELFRHPEHPYTQGLIASTPMVDQTQERLTTIPGNVPDLIDVPYACHFAPRCPEAKEECFEIEPDFRDVRHGDEEHTAKCLRRGPEEEQI
ncbi:MAG: ABC transporter ATP-binding protein [Halobacteriales archaeon]